MKKLTFLLALALLTACHSSKTTVDESDHTPSIPTEPARPTAPGTTTANTKKDDKQQGQKNKAIANGTNFTAKVKVTVTRDGKSIATTGALRMRYNDVIQLTLTDPVLHIAEVGRLELSPNNVLIIDRLNKRYVSTNYDELHALRNSKTGFSEVQDMFWKEAQEKDAFSYTIPSGQVVKLDLQLSDKGSASNWEAHTSVSSRYTKTDINQLFGSMIER